VVLTQFFIVIEYKCKYVLFGRIGFRHKTVLCLNIFLHRGTFSIQFCNLLYITSFVRLYWGGRLIRVIEVKVHEVQCMFMHRC
jgi:hypothetical protein